MHGTGSERFVSIHQFKNKPLEESKHFNEPVNVSQFAMRRVVPSLLRMIGPHSSKRMDSPNLMDGRFESGSGGGS